MLVTEIVLRGKTQKRSVLLFTPHQRLSPLSFGPLDMVPIAHVTY